MKQGKSKARAGKARRQKRVPGVVRERLSLTTEHDQAVRAEARHFRCSMSFVLNTCVAVALRLPLAGAEDYREPIKGSKAGRVLRIVQGGAQGRRKAG